VIARSVELEVLEKQDIVELVVSSSNEYLLGYSQSADFVSAVAEFYSWKPLGMLGCCCLHMLLRALQRRPDRRLADCMQQDRPLDTVFPLGSQTLVAAVTDRMQLIPISLASLKLKFA
jgi:gamma-glutamyl phosphate reductase